MDTAYLTTPVTRWYTDADMPMLIEKARELRKIGLRFSPEDVGGNDRLRRIYAALATPTTNRRLRRKRDRDKS